MAQQALGAGMIVPRKRALFGLLDADGWAWARSRRSSGSSIIILLLGYIPDRAYYFTVNRTSTSACSPGRRSTSARPRTRRCRARRRSAPSCPWHQSPAELALPAAAHRRRRGPARHQDPVHRRVRRHDGAVDVYVAPDVRDRQLRRSGPTARRCRSRAPTPASSRSPAPSTSSAASTPTARRRTTVFSLTPDREDRRPRRVEDRDETWRLPERARRRRRASPPPTASSLVGGESARRTRRRPSGKSLLRHGGHAPEVGGRSPPRSSRRPTRCVRSSVTTSGCTAATTPTDRSAPCSAGRSASAAAEGLPDEPRRGQGRRLGASTPAANLPGARDDAAGWSANGTLYLVGGAGQRRPADRGLLGGPDRRRATIPEWKHLDASDLPYGLTGGSAVVTGPNAVLVGGETADGVPQTSLRANTAPQSPFFQLGLVRRDRAGASRSTARSASSSAT